MTLTEAVLPEGGTRHARMAIIATCMVTTGNEVGTQDGSVELAWTSSISASGSLGMFIQ